MSWWRRLLNLPPKGESWADQRRSKRQRRPARGRAKAKAPDWETIDPDWWVQPAEPASAPPLRTPGAATQQPTQQTAGHGGVIAPPRQHARHQAPRPEPVAPRETPWQTEAESSFANWGRRFLRGLVVVVLLLAAVSGVRSWIRPAGTESASTGSESSYPRDEAKAVATRFATSYMTWDEGNRDARSAAIALDLAAGLDTGTGWNGRGKQTAGTAYPGEVKVDPGGVAANVDVRVLVTPASKREKLWVPGQPAWQRLSVPVAKAGARVVVSGPPTYVADDPAKLPEDMPKLGGTDDELTELTHKDAEAFFRAYASSDAAVEAVAAPGTGIRSLNGIVKLDGLRAWQVYAGDANERRATAAVTWAGSGDTTLAQTYTLTLRRTVAADGAERWQVAAIG